MTQIKLIDLMPYVVALSLGLCAAASTAGCTEERAKAVAPSPEQETLEVNTKLQDKAEEAIELSNIKPPKKQIPVEEASVSKDTVEKELPDHEPMDPVYEATLLENEGIMLRRLKTTQEIDKREPVFDASSFPVGTDRIYAFMDVRNDTDEEQKLTVNFIGPEDQVRGGIEVVIPAKVQRWRTWAYSRNIQAKGEWEAEVRSVEGTLLGAIRFDVE